MGAPNAKGINENYLVRFVAFKKPFEEAVFAENLLAIQEAEKIEKDEHYRVYPASPSDLLKAGSKKEDNGNEKYIGDKWGGKYLRAPDIYFTIMEKGKGKLVRLGDIAEIKFGIKTGANDFFYLRPLGPGSRAGLLRVRNGAGWEGELEEEFLKPVIKSPRECRTIKISPAELKYRIFMCHKSKEELRGTKALEYIEWGEHQEIMDRQGQQAGQIVIGYQNIPTPKKRSKWWSLGLVDSRIAYPSTHNPTWKIVINEDRFALDKVFYGIDSDDYLFIAIMLLSSVSLFFAEFYGYSLMGGGGSFITVEDLSNKLMIMKKEIFSFTEINYLQNLLLDIGKREIKRIFEELGYSYCTQPNCKDHEHPLEMINPDEFNDPTRLNSIFNDRRQLDEFIFHKLGLTLQEELEFYKAITIMVRARVLKPLSMKKI